MLGPGDVPPPGVVLQLQPPEGPALTLPVDPAGAFRIEALSPGPYTLRATAPGAAPAAVELHLEAGRIIAVALRLTREDDVEATIVAEESALAPELTSRVMERRALRTQPGTGGDAVRALQALPGVARAPFGIGTLLVRGTGPDDSGFYLGGAPIPAVYHFGGLCTVVNADSLSAVELLPGAYSVRYGGHLGGVVNLALDEQRADAGRGYLSVDLYQTSAFAILPVTDATTLTLSGRRSYVDAVLAPLFSSSFGGGVTVQLPVYSDVLLRAQHETDGGADFDLVFSQVGDKAGEAEPNTDGSMMETTLSLRSLRLWGQVRPSAWGRLRPTFTAWAGPTDKELAFVDLVSAREEVDAIGLRAELLCPLDAGLGFLLGAEAHQETWSFDYADTGGLLGFLGYDAGREFGQGTLHRLGLYAEQRQRWGPVDLSPGLRLDLTDTPAATLRSLDPRLALRWTLRPRRLLLVGLGQYSQPPAPRELLTNWANPALTPARALSATLGLRQGLGPDAELELTAYHSALQDLIVGHEGRLEMRFALPPTLNADHGDYANAGAGTTDGIEALARWRGEVAEAWAGLTLARSVRQNREGDSALFAYDQPLLATLVASRDLPHQVTAGLRLRGGSGNPYGVVDGRVWSVDSLSYLPLSQSQGRLPPSFTVDVRIDKRWDLRRHALTAYIDLLNATNRPNVEMVNYNFDYTAEVPVYGLPIFPAFGLRGDW